LRERYRGIRRHDPILSVKLLLNAQDYGWASLGSVIIILLSYGRRYREEGGRNILRMREGK